MAKSKKQQAMEAVYASVMESLRDASEPGDTHEDVNFTYSDLDDGFDGLPKEIKDQMLLDAHGPVVTFPVTIQVSETDLKKIQEEAKDSCLTGAAKASIAAAKAPAKPRIFLARKR